MPGGKSGCSDVDNANQGERLLSKWTGKEHMFSLVHHLCNCMSSTDRGTCLDWWHVVNWMIIMDDHFPLIFTYCEGWDLARDAKGVVSILTPTDGSGSRTQSWGVWVGMGRGVDIGSPFPEFIIISVLMGERKWSPTDLRVFLLWI